MVGLKHSLIISLFLIGIIGIANGAITPPVPSQHPNVWYHFDTVSTLGSNVYFPDSGTSPNNMGIIYFGSGSCLVTGLYASSEGSDPKGFKIVGTDYVEIVDSDDLSNTNQLTIEFYVYLSDDFDGWIAENYNINYFYILSYEGGKFNLALWDVVNSEFVTLRSPQLPAGRWYYVAFTIDSVNDIAKLYVNGKKVDGRTIPTNWVIEDGVTHKIGSDLDSQTGYFIVDEYRLYNYTLSEEEILKHTELLRVSGYDEKTGDDITANLEVILSGTATYNFQYDSDLNKFLLFGQSGFEFGYYWLTAKNDSYYERTFTVHLDDALKQVDVYLVNKSDEVIFQVFKLNDFYNQFTKPRLVLGKYVNGKLVTVLDKLFDFNDQAQDYLLWGSQYQLSVVDDEKGIQLTVGWFSPDPDGVVEITPNLYAIPEIREDVTVEFSADKNTGIITLNYNCSSEITKAEFYVNLTNGSNVFYSYSTEKSGSFTFNANNSTSYEVHFIVWNGTVKIYERSWYVGWGGKEELFILPSTFPRWTYTIISVGMIILMLLLFGSYNATVGTGLAFGLSLLLWWFGWLDVNEIVLGLMGLIAGASVIYHHRRRMAG